MNDTLVPKPDLSRPDPVTPSEQRALWLQRLSWLDAEITRYRDFEWKATSFHATFFVALIYIFLDVDRREVLAGNGTWLMIGVVGYLIISVTQMVYIHQRLNQTRSARSRLLYQLGEDQTIFQAKYFELWEGPGAIFPIGFVLALGFLGLTALRLVLSV